MSVPLISGDRHTYFPKILPATAREAGLSCFYGFVLLLRAKQQSTSTQPKPGPFEAYKYNLTTAALKALANTSDDLYCYQKPEQFLQRLKETPAKTGLLNQAADALDPVLNQVAAALGHGNWSSLLVMHELNQQKNAPKTLTQRIVDETGPAPSRNEMLLDYKQPEFAEQAALAFNALTHNYHGGQPVGDQILTAWHEQKILQPVPADDIAVRNAAVAFYQALATVSARLAAAEVKTPHRTSPLAIQAQKLAGIVRDVAAYCMEIGYYLDPSNGQPSYDIGKILSANQIIFAAAQKNASPQEKASPHVKKFAAVEEIAIHVQGLFGNNPAPRRVAAQGNGPPF